MSAPNSSSGVYWTANGTVCNADQWNQFNFQSLDDHKHPNITCLSHGQTIGLALTAEASILSFAAVILVFVLIGRNVRRYRRALPNGGWKLLRQPADIFMLSLFVFDMLQAVGGILDIKWAHDGIVTTGHYCTAQGIIQQTGELGVALITLIITIHALGVTILPAQQPAQQSENVARAARAARAARLFAFGVVVLASLFIVLWVGIGNGTYRNYETPTPYWCWISPGYSRERLAGEYIWLWIALLASVMVYTPLYFRARGHEQMQAALAMPMLFYPLAYSLVVLPISITRWLEFKNSNTIVPSAATFFAVSLFNLSGAINVFRFLMVRSPLLLFTPPEEY